MGKTNQPLTIWVHEAYEHHEKAKELEAKGHDLLVISVCGQLPPREPDLILHPAAHQWHDGMWPYLDVTLKAARARKYTTKKGKKNDAKAGK